MFSGTVRMKGSGEAVAGANVILQTKDGSNIIGFASTDANGEYDIKCKGKRDSVSLKVTGFNVKLTVVKVSYRTQTVNFSVEYERITLHEVVVKSEPIERRSDTLNYYVASYIDSLDSSIGDVLKKMPGIDVEKSGEIKYNNKPINKFYIEGLDMMGGRYGVATNNVRARDIASVQVLENHQPVKALKNIVFSNDAAINLKLKDKAKGTFAAEAQLGAGYSPLMWNAELTAMKFSSDFQTLCTYKTNDSGDDILAELTSFYGGLSKESAMTGVYTPSTPDIENGRYMDNLTHAVSLNALFKLDNDNNLTVNCKYVHDLEKFASSSTTIYYLPESSPLEIKETANASELTDGMELGLKLEKNTEKIYLKENLVLGADWDRNAGMVLNGSDSVFQKFKLPSIRIKNNLNFIKVINGVRFSFQSAVNAEQLPATLTVSPVIFPEIFGADATGEGALLQSVGDRKISTTNYLWTAYTIRDIYTFSARAGVSADLLGMESSLSRTDSPTVTADSLRNDSFWKRLDGSLFLSFTYRHGNYDFSIGSNLDYMNLRMNDYVRTASGTLNRFFADPNVSFNVKLSPSLNLSVEGSLSHRTGAVGSNYAGYVMTDYRMLSSSDGNIRESVIQNCNARLSYGDAVISTFGSLNVSYWRAKSNLMYGTQYYGSLSRIESFAIDNLSQGFSTVARMEKRFDDLATTVGIPLSYNRTYMDILRQGKIMKTVYDSFSSGLEVSSRFSRHVKGDYKIDYVRSKSAIENSSTTISPINALHQKLSFYFTVLKSLTFNISGDHYFNDAITSGTRSMFFADASINYKTRYFEYILEGRNFLNTDTYYQRIYTDITDYEYGYHLRPVSVMLKVRFSIK